MHCIEAGVVESHTFKVTIANYIIILNEFNDKEELKTNVRHWLRLRAVLDLSQSLIPVFQWQFHTGL